MGKNKAAPAQVFIRVCLIAGLALSLLFLTQYINQNFVNSLNDRPGGDFVVFWKSAVALHEGGPAAVYAVQPDEAGEWIPHIPPYPPFFFPLLVPLGALGYGAALALWLLVPFALYAAAVFKSPWWRDLEQDKKLAAAAVLLYAGVICNTMAAQTGTLTAALLIAGLSAWRRAPYLAGVCFGLLAFKPQLGLLLPVALIAAREWRIFAAAAATAATLALGSLALCGVEAWQLYFAYAIRFGEYAAAVPPDLQRMIASPYGWLRLVGAPAALAAAVQAGLALACAWFTWRAFRNGFSLQAGAQLVALTYLASPYVMAYDLVGLVIPALYLAAKPAINTTERLVLFALLTAPLLAPGMNAALIPFVPVMLVCILVK